MKNEPSTILDESELEEGFMLGDILVLPEKREFVYAKRHAHMSVKAMQLLVYLCRFQGEILSKADIAEHLWQNQQVDPKAIKSLIAEIRKTLYFHPDKPRFLQTVKPYGYRMKKVVTLLDDAMLSSDVMEAAIDDEESEKKQHFFSFLSDAQYWKNSKLFQVAGAYMVMSWVLIQVVSLSIPVLELPIWTDKVSLLLLVIGGPIVLWYNWWYEYKLREKFLKRRKKRFVKARINFFLVKDLSVISALTVVALLMGTLMSKQLYDAIQSQDNVVSASPIRATFYPDSIAVMPFAISGDNIEPGFSDTFQSELVSFLSQTKELRVVSSRVLSAIPDNASIAQILSLTGAKYILEGSATQNNENLVLVATLIDSESGHQVWSNRAVTATTNSLDLIETLSSQVFNAVTFLLPVDTSTERKYKPTNNINAYDAYIRARTQLRDAYNVSQLEQVKSLFLEALNFDSSFVSAQLGLCQTYIEQYSLEDALQIFELAKQACEFNDTQDINLAEKNIALGRLYSISGDYSLAIEYFDKGLALEPRNTFGLTEKAKALARLEDDQGAELHFKQAMQLEPGYWRNYEQYGVYLFSRGNYQRASTQFYKQTLLQPTSEEAFNNLGAAYYLDGNYDEAVNSWRQSAVISPSANTFSNLGTSMFFAQQFENAITMYKEAVKRDSNDHILHANLADAMKYAGFPEQEVRATYEKALTLAMNNLAVNPSLVSLQSNIARYRAELKLCLLTQQDIEQIIQNDIDDPYVYYELAIASIQCGNRESVVRYLQNTLALGYPKQLLMSDHQFSDYKQAISAVAP